MLKWQNKVIIFGGYILSFRGYTQILAWEKFVTVVIDGPRWELYACMHAKYGNL